MRPEVGVLKRQRQVHPGPPAPGAVKRSSAVIKTEIEELFGFFPPFFDPALGIPDVLDNLWQQTLSAYVNNPLPATAKERLFAYLSRECAVPDGIVCHSCFLRPLGMPIAEALALLDSDPPVLTGALATELDALLAETAPLEAWPEEGSRLSVALLRASMVVFLEPGGAGSTVAELRRLLGPLGYAQLIAFLSYARACFAWVEAHPELTHEAVERVQTNLGPRLAAEPALAEFFRSYPERRRRSRSGRAQRGLMPAPAAPRPAEDVRSEFPTLMEHVPVPMALVGRDLTLVAVNQALCDWLGYERAALVGRVLPSLAHPVDADFGSAAAQPLPSGEWAAYRADKRFVRSDGNVIGAALTLTMISDESGAPQHRLGILQQIRRPDAGDEGRAAAAETLGGPSAEPEHEERQIRLLGELGDLLQTCLTLVEVRDVLGKFARQLFPTQSGALYNLDEVRHIASVAVSWGSSSGSEEAFAPDDCWALRRGRLHAVRDPDAGLACPHVRVLPSGGYVCAPLLDPGGALGVLHIRAESAPISEGATYLAAALAQEVGLVLSNLRLRDTLRTQVMRDPLTALYNRRSLEELLDRESQRAHRHTHPLAVAVANIDHFRQFNDAYGRQAGDELLRSVGAFLQSHVRSEDWPCRYGGDAFVVIMPESTAEGARAWAERFREQVKRVEVPYWGRRLPAVSVSLGVAADERQRLSGRDLLQLADEAVYRAKANGRDQVSVAATEA